MIHPTLSHFHSHIPSTPADRYRLRLRPRSAHARIGPGPGVAVPTLCMRYLHAEYSVYEKTPKTPPPPVSTGRSGVASIVASRVSKDRMSMREDKHWWTRVQLRVVYNRTLCSCTSSDWTLQRETAPVRSRVVIWDASPELGGFRDFVMEDGATIVVRRPHPSSSTRRWREAASSRSEDIKASTMPRNPDRPSPILINSPNSHSTPASKQTTLQTHHDQHHARSQHGHLHSHHRH